MTNLRNHFTGLALLLCAAGCGTIDAPLNPWLARVTPAPRDHYDPAYLNEAAVAAWSRGERGTALLLLERAAVIAPQDQRILHNLETVKTAGNRTVLMHYQPLPERALAADGKAAAAITPQPGTAMPALPAFGLWPAP